MYMKTILFSINLILAGGQIPLNGDSAALHKMKASLLYEENTSQRLEAREAGLFERALHRMRALEKKTEIEEFIERGSLFLPSGDTGDTTGEPGAILNFNKDVGVQKIDPRTPKGFGNPFFRQIHVEQEIKVKKLLSETEEAFIRSEGQSLNPVIRSGWTYTRGLGSMISPYDQFSEFMANFMSSPNKIIRRVCESCHVEEYKEIFYKRLTTPTSKAFFSAMINGPMDDTTQQVCNIDFTLHSTYADAISGANPWTYCANSVFGFPADSGSLSSTSCFHERQYNGGSNGQPDYAFYVEESAWVPVAGFGVLDIPGTRNGEIIEQTYISTALQRLYESGNGIFRMICTDCDEGYKDVYYKRITALPDDLMITLMYDFKLTGGNVINRDFKIFSTYEDALNDVNAWEVCETPPFRMAFPAQCKPKASDPTPIRFHRSISREVLYSRDESSTNRHLAFYIESEYLPETEAWMSEYDEMNAFFHPESTLQKDDEIMCQPASFDDTSLQQVDLEAHFFGNNNLIPYVLQGAADIYSGWYDVTGCGQCNDWCGWFLPRGRDDYVQINPYYRSWLMRDHVFACVTSSTDETTNYLRVSGADPTEYVGGPVDVSMYPEFSDHDYSGWLKFFPTTIQKCAKQGDPAPPRTLYQYVGCYKDAADRALPIKASDSMTLEECFNACKSLGKHYFGRQGLGECWCGGDDVSDTSYSKHGETGSFEVEMSDECYPNCITWESANPQTLAVDDPSIADAYDIAASYCSPLVDFSLSSNTGCSSCSQVMTSHDSCIIRSSSSDNLGNGEYKLSFSGVVPSAPGGCCTANSCVGGKLQTGSFAFDSTRHEGVEWKFFASGGGDWYEVIVAMYEASDTTYQNPVFSKCYRGDFITSSTLVQMPVTQDGQYVVVFYGGSYDRSGGTVLGASINVQYFSIYLKTSARNLQEDKNPMIISKNQKKDRKLQSGFVTQQCGDRCETMNIGSFLNCVYQIFYDPAPSPSSTCNSLTGSLTSDFPPDEVPSVLSFPVPSNDPFAGYYDVQRCGSCNDWCGWVGKSDAVSLLPDPWFQTETDTHFFTCKLAGGYSSEFGMTEKGYFGSSFPYQKCSGKGAPTLPYRKETFVGCFHDDSTKSLLPHIIGNGLDIPFYDCADACRHKGYHYFGRQANGECRCSGTSVSNKAYENLGEIFPSDPNYCGDCLGSDIGINKNCVFRILDQFDPIEERKKHPCSHISLKDIRRYCYVACRDKDEAAANLVACTTLSAQGYTELEKEIAAWADSPICDTMTCQTKKHPLALYDVKRAKGTF